MTQEMGTKPAIKNKVKVSCSDTKSLIVVSAHIAKIFFLYLLFMPMPVKQTGNLHEGSETEECKVGIGSNASNSMKN